MPRGWRSFYMPTKADTVISLWRRWLEAFTDDANGPYMLAAATSQQHKPPEAANTPSDGPSASDGTADVPAVAEAAAKAAAVAAAEAWATSQGSSSGPGISKRELLDRWNEHVKGCPSCSGAMRNFQSASWAAAAAAVVCAQLAMLTALGVWAAGASGLGIVPPQGIAIPLPLPILSTGWAAASHLVVPAKALVTALFVAAAALCVKISSALSAMHQAFIYKDYVHAHI